MSASGFEDDPALQAWLRAAAPPAVPDEGFTARVMAALPPAPDRAVLERTRRVAGEDARWWRWTGAGLALGALLAILAVGTAPPLPAASPTAAQAGTAWALAVIAALASAWQAWRER